MIDSRQYEVRTPPPSRDMQAGAPTRIAAWVLVVLGLGLGVFGGYRLVSHYGEIGRLEDRLTVLQTERAGVEARAETLQGRVAALSSASADLDAAVGRMVEGLEAYTDAYQESVTWYNAALDAALAGNFQQARVLASGEYAEAARAAEQALSELQDATSAVGTLLAEAQTSLAPGTEG